MTLTDKEFVIKSSDTYLMNDSKAAYKVRRGKVFVYIMPLGNEKPVKRSLIYLACEGEVIPSLYFRDAEYCTWSFCLIAENEAEIQKIHNGATKILKERFAQKAGIKNYEKEGFEGGVVDMHKMNLLSEDSFIKRTQAHKEETSGKINGLISDSFKKKQKNGGSKSEKLLYAAMNRLCKNQGTEIAPYDKITAACGDNFTVADIARISHFSYREITLTHGWEKGDNGSFLAFRQDGKPVVCLSKGTNSYVMWDAEKNSKLPVTAQNVGELGAYAYMIYTPLPEKSLTPTDLISYCTGKIRRPDFILFLFLTLAVSLIGLIAPYFSGSIYDRYIPLGEKNTVFQIGALLISFTVANTMFLIVKNILSYRISSVLSYDLQSAVYDRLFNLPESFFRKYEFADLAQRVMGVAAFTQNVTDSVISAAIAVICLLVSFCAMLTYSWVLSLAGLVMSALFGAVYYLISIRVLRHKVKAIEFDARSSSQLYQFISAIAKIRITGSEESAIYEYFKTYVKQRDEQEKSDRAGDIGSAVSSVSASLLTVIFYVLFVKVTVNVPLGSFLAFNALFGSFFAYVLQLVNALISVKNEKPDIERLSPVLNTVPEYDSSKVVLGELSGRIDIEDVSFSYEKNSPLVFDRLNLSVKPGEYIGIVGSSGCGKSTLLKLLLGFEKPLSGKILYDGRDVEDVDKRELRKKMGVVLQNGKLVSGSIYENITVTASHATVSDVEKVIESVGLKDDIDEMPMGLHTVLSEDCSTISGGQQQRILIARALISQPEILLFDEATSALDNISQAMVCDTLEKLPVTKLVIAHRLSTIMGCDRIIVLDKGRIAEQGDYRQLMEKRGLFYSLATRQLI